MKLLPIFIILGVAIAFASGRRFERCELARILHNRYGFPRNQLADWICLVEWESSFRTDAVGPPNGDGSRDWGLFQINDRYWCQSANYGNSHNICGVSCERLLSDDITTAVNCVRKIYAAHGFSGWNAWTQHCHSPSSVEHCFVESDCLPGGVSFGKHWL
ncbi:lysozyme-like [Hermetia illucens]|uniref:lysozyme-like n=1 Tax=Hermetia illucens TaxID=343691 RepID=UPI0018CC3D9A|nr:lysozyme-like [Hermetia illucens]